MCCVNKANDNQDLHRTAQKNFTGKKLLQAKIELYKEGFLIGVED